MKHAIVQSKPGMFYGWPANSGAWVWGDEIVVGFTESYYQKKAESHSQDEAKPRAGIVARSQNSGRAWRTEYPENYPEGYVFGNDERPARASVGAPAPIDFLHPDLAIRCRNGHFLVSLDRCRTWMGPYWFPTFGFETGFTARTDYVIRGSRECVFLLSVRDPEVQSGIKDRAFAVRTSDGGKSFDMLGWMLPENPEVRSAMPSTVLVGKSTLVSALRRRIDHADGYSECWIDAAVSGNGGLSWRYSSKIADTHTREHQHNGNPPSLSKLPDGRLVVVYGYRAPPYGIRAKISSDNGRTWGREIILRDDGVTWDIGYPRSVVLPDGSMACMYYFATESLPEQHIAATLWKPEEF